MGVRRAARSGTDELGGGGGKAGSQELSGLPPPSPRLYFSFSFSKCSFSFSLMKLLSFSSRTLHEKCSSKSAYT